MRFRTFMAVALVLTACGGGKEPAQRTTTPPPESTAAAQPATATAAPAAPVEAAATPVSGDAVYHRICVTCHQANGQGMPGAFPPIAGSPIVNGPVARYARVVLNGVTGPLTVKGKRFNGTMPAWKGQLSDAEIAAVMTYERSSFGNSAGPVTQQEVAQQRAATASRTQPLTAADIEH